MPRSNRKKVYAGGTGNALDQALHYMRYMRVEDGESPAAVARSEGITVRSVEKSIRTVKYQKALYTQANLNGAVIGMLLSQLPQVKETFERMFAAKEYIERKNVDGSTELVPVEDKEIQLEALRVFGEYASTMQPRTGGVNVKVQQNNANQATSISGGKGGYESMLHQVIKEANSFNQLPAVTADVIDDEDYSDDDDDDETMTA